MSRVVGIDPGTLSFDLCGLDNGRVFLDTSITSPEIAAAPKILVDALSQVQPLDLVIGPSGYGLPWVQAKDLSDEDLFLLALADDRERGQASGIGGLRQLVTLLGETGLPVVFMPGVIHLPTVPAYRKANKIDIGTADKLCAVALGIFDQARRLQLPFQETSFIYVELGGAFTAVIAVEKGQVVDGLGGSSGAPGFHALGSMDGELAYLLGTFSKKVLFSGGVASIAGKPGISPEEATPHGEDTRLGAAWAALFEGVTKSVAAEMTVVPSAREILLSGRLCRSPAILETVTNHLSKFAPVRRVAGLATTAKEAAQGAALIADGLSGGPYAPLVETMRLKEAEGTVLDYLHISEAKQLRQRYLTRS